MRVFKILCIGLGFNFFIFFPNDLKKYKVGLLVMATGKYTLFLEPLFKSANKYFLPDHEVIYFVFTDGKVPENRERSVIKIYQERMGWPFDTMMRFDVYYKAREYFKNIDYLYATDADMLFVDVVGDEILGERVATRHPGFLFDLKEKHQGHMYDRHDDYDQNPNSAAYVASHEGDFYFAGGFYGGSTSEFLMLTKMCTQAIKKDLKEHNYIAKNNDESHLNRYFIDHKPTVILSPCYCYPESWDIPFSKKLLALDKNHSEFQIPKK